jgi:hypothetical protein
MKKIFILGFIIFLTTELFAQPSSTAAIKQTINTMLDAMRNGDSTLLRSVLTKNMELQSAAIDTTGRVSLSTEGANGLVTLIGTPHTDVYDERIVFGGIEIDGPLASVWTPYKFYLGTTFSHCGVNFFQLARMNDGWKIIHIAYTVMKDNCYPNPELPGGLPE